MKRMKRINSIDNKIDRNENDACETATVTKTEQVVFFDFELI